jgi:hypothetical protein
MAYRPRRAVPAYPHHIIQRGTKRQAILAHQAGDTAGARHWDGAVVVRDRRDAREAVGGCIARTTAQGVLGPANKSPLTSWRGIWFHTVICNPL